MKKQHVTLTDADRTTLEALLAKAFKRGTALLELDRGKTLAAVAETLDVDYNTVAAWRTGYRTKGLDCLYDAPRSGRPIEIDGNQRAYLTALACSDAPEGHARWTLQLLADKVVEAGVCATLSHTMVGKILKKRPEAASESDVVHGGAACAVPFADGTPPLVVWSAL